MQRFQSSKLIVISLGAVILLLAVLWFKQVSRMQAHAQNLISSVVDVHNLETSVKSLAPELTEVSVNRKIISESSPRWLEVLQSLMNGKFVIARTLIVRNSELVAEFKYSVLIGPFNLHLLTSTEFIFGLSLVLVLLASFMKLRSLAEKELEAYRLAHDIKGPLMALKTAQALPDQNKGRELIQAAESSLLLMSESLLLKRKYAEKTDLDKLLAYLRRYYQFQNPTVVMKLRTDHSGSLPGSFSEIFRAIDNLVANSLAAHASEISMKFSLQQDRWQFDYQDNGMGMEANQLEAFGSGAVTADGNGLGSLAVVSFLRKNQWTWQINSKPGHGFHLKALSKASSNAFSFGSFLGGDFGKRASANSKV